jgi:hypothetical protein
VRKTSTNPKSRKLKRLVVRVKTCLKLIDGLAVSPTIELRNDEIVLLLLYPYIFFAATT